MKKTKIVATVGPACQDVKVLSQLILRGVNVFRINASHTTPASLRKWIRKIRKTAADLKTSTAVMVDLQGPRVRTGSLAGVKVMRLKKGAKVNIIVSVKPGYEGNITTSCMEFPSMVKRHDRVLIDNGFLELEVTAVQKRMVECRVVNGGILGENKGINLPNAPVTLPALGAKDRRDLSVAAEEGVDYVALSFVRSERDVLDVRAWLKKHHTEIPIIAKIEKPRAVDCIDKILAVVDAVMVARGDLGIEMGVEKIPMIQKQLITAANRCSVPVITATQMLESMITSARPTRAEASDIANAVLDGTDAVMLSGETAVGHHPLAAVSMMSKIIMEAEQQIGELNSAELLEAMEKEKDRDLAIHAITHAARHAAKDLRAKAVIVFTISGRTVALLSKFRPQTPIVALTPSYELSRRLCLYRGVVSHKIRYGRSLDAMIRQGDKALIRKGLLKKGDFVVVLSGKQAFPETRYMTKIHQIGRS